MVHDDKAMTDIEQKEQGGLIQGDEEEINLLEYLLVLVKRKKMIMGVCIVVALLTCAVSLLIPNRYIATARILPPQDDKSGLATSLGGLGGVASLAGISLGGGAAEQYIGMLQSRTIADAIIDRFHLMDVYEQEYRLKAYKELSNHVDISLGEDDGIISIAVEDEDPHRAADMANAYVEQLKELNVSLNFANAGRERLFLEDRLKKVKTDLQQAEDNLQKFQEANKTVRIDEQVAAIIGNIAELKGKLASKEVELGVLLSYQTEQNPQVRSVRESIEQLQKQIKQMETSPDGQKVSDDIFIATSQMPELGVQYARLLRDFKIQETLFQLLIQQYELAKINEAKNTSTLQTLDEAVAPDYKSKPKRSLIVILATFVAGFLAVIWAFVSEYMQRLPETDRRLWDEIKRCARWKFRTTHDN